jgi:phospholipase C
MLTRRIFMQLMGGASAAVVTGTGLLTRAASAATSTVSPNGRDGVEHIVIVMMENRSFDHFLGWLPGADGRQDLAYLSADGNVYPNYPLAPDFQGCGYSDPDHSWEGWLVQHNGGKMDGFLQRPTAPTDNPGVTLATANTFPVGYYTNRDRDGRPKPVPDLPVLGALAEHYTVLDRYFCSFAGETFPNRFYQHAARTDRDHNSAVVSTLPSIWDRLSPIPNTQGIPTGGYFFRDLPFLALWGVTYFPFWHPFAAGDGRGLGVPITTLPFLDMVHQGLLPNVSFVDPAFDTEAKRTSADDRPPADIRLGERFIADTYHALASAGYLDNTVLMITFDEWGGFYDHVSPPHVIDDTNPADVGHSGDSTPTGGRLMPDYTQLGFRVPAMVVSNLAERGVVHHGPFEHTSTLKLIESTFGLTPLTARDANAEDLGLVLRDRPRHRPLLKGAIPTRDQVLGPASGADASCSAGGVQSVSPKPLQVGTGPRSYVLVPRSGMPTGAGMAGLGRRACPPARAWSTWAASYAANHSSS